MSLILNARPHRFSDATVARVHEAAAALDYQPSAAGRTLARGKSDLVVALVPDTTFGESLQAVFDVVTDILARSGYTLVLRFATSSRSSLDSLLASMKPVAVIDFGATLDSPSRTQLEARGTRVLGLDLGYGAEPVSLGEVNRHMGWVQADYLIARGASAIGYAHLLDSRADIYGDDRERGVAERCAQASLPAPFVMHVAPSAEVAAAELRRLNPSPGAAVACYSDEVAAAVIAGGGLVGLSVPRDLRVMGSDNTRFGQLFRPRLTSLAVDFSRGGEVLAGAVLAELEGAAVAPRHDSNAVFSMFSIVEGESV